MLTRLKFHKCEGKLLVASLDIRRRRRRDTRAPSSPKFPLITTLEEPQFLSQETEIEEVQIAQEAKLIEEVQAPAYELESIAIMSSVGEREGHSEEDDVKREFNDINRIVKIMFDAFTVGMEGEGFKPPHGEGTSDGKKDEEKSSKGSGGNPPPSPPYSSSTSSPSATSYTSTTKKPLTLTQKPQKEIHPYSNLI